MKKRIAIDFGTSVCRAAVEREEGVAFLPSLAALERSSGKPLCFGEEAKLLSLRTPGDLDLIRPFSDPANLEPGLIEGMLSEISAELDRPKGFHTDLVLSLPAVFDRAAEQKILDAALSLKANNLTVVNPLHAILEGLKPSGEKVLLLHTGASCTELCYDTGSARSEPLFVPVGGKTFDDAIGDYLYDRHGILLDDFGAERAKLSGATLDKENAEAAIVCKGLGRRSGLPKNLTVPSAELFDVMEPLLALICSAIGNLTSAYGRPDTVLLSGGGAVFSGFSYAIADAVRAPAKILREPENAVILGLKAMMEDGTV